MDRKDSHDIGDYVLIKKKLLEDWALTVSELNKTLLWLKDERERLLALNDQYEHLARETDTAAKKLMKMFEDTRSENKRLTEALIDRMPKIKRGQAS
jgi:DNA-directed RNA polymerase subunit F